MSSTILTIKKFDVMFALFRERGRDKGDLRSRMKDKRDKLERQSYAARVLGDLVGAGDTDTAAAKSRKRRSDQRAAAMEEEEDEIDRLEKKMLRIESPEPAAKKKKKSKDKKEKKSKKSKKSRGDDKDSPSPVSALQMAQDFSKEYEPIRSRKMKVKMTDEAADASLSLDTSLDAVGDKGVEVSETSGDVMKDLDDFLND